MDSRDRVERGGPRSGRRLAPERAWRRARGRRWAHACLVALLGLSGCTYSFSGSSVPAHIKSIAVPTFENETLQPGLEGELTEATIDAFVNDNRLNVGGAGNADAVVEGRIVRYDHGVFGVGNTDQAQEYRVTLRVAVTVKDRVKGKDLWSEESMVAQSAYRVGGTGQGPANEEEARLEAVDKIAADILANTLEEW